jgi:hypothetical protein
MVELLAPARSSAAFSGATAGMGSWVMAFTFRSLVRGRSSQRDNLYRLRESETHNNDAKTSLHLGA